MVNIFFNALNCPRQQNIKYSYLTTNECSLITFLPLAETKKILISETDVTVMKMKKHLTLKLLFRVSGAARKANKFGIAHSALQVLSESHGRQYLNLLGRSYEIRHTRT